MPNYVTNNVTMKNISNLSIYSKDDNGKKMLDFNKIIPMPDSLDMDDGTITDIAIDEVLLKIMSYVISENTFGQLANNRADVYNKMLLIHQDRLPAVKLQDRENLTDIGLQYIFNIIQYGYPTWYKWCINNWSTKWNAYETEILSDDCIQFITAWNIPYNIFMELSKRNPYNEIRVDWVEEGGTCGVTSFLDGECIEDQQYFMVYDNDEDFKTPKLFTKVEKIQ